MRYGRRRSSAPRSRTARRGASGGRLASTYLLLIAASAELVAGAASHRSITSVAVPGALVIPPQCRVVADTIESDEASRSLGDPLLGPREQRRTDLFSVFAARDSQAVNVAGILRLIRPHEIVAPLK